MSLTKDTPTFVQNLRELVAMIEQPLADVLWSEYSVGDSAPIVAREIEQELWLFCVLLNQQRGSLNGEQLKFLGTLIGQASYPPRTATVDELKLGLSNFSKDSIIAGYPTRILKALLRYDKDNATSIADIWKRFLLSVATAVLSVNPKVERFQQLWRELSASDIADGSIPLARNRHLVSELEQALNQVTPDVSAKSPKKSSGDQKVLKDAMADLDRLVGLATLKEQVQQIIAAVKVRQQREAEGLKNPAVGRHLIFCGNPGTGKTVVARIVARIFNGLGVVSKGQLVEADRAKLVGEYVGHTAAKTRNLVESAKGGILFIDEVYSLMNNSSDSFGQECIDTLVKEIEDNRDDLIVIVAGYTDKMNQFLNSNPGLQSRFGKQLIFEDYSATELTEIFRSMVQNGDYALEPDAEEKLPQFFTRMIQQKDQYFGNGREVRKFFESAVQHQGSRLGKLANPSKSELLTLSLSDLESYFGTNQSSRSVDEITEDLNRMVGLASVKEDVQSLINSLRVQKLREAQGLPRVGSNNHIVFAGNPGTGKTTVARLLGGIYRELGFLSKGHYVEIDRERLIAGFVGQTAIKTKQQVEGALGGVLFIDEVYSLVSSDHDEFGQEAIDTLVKLIEDYREQMVVIVAGYPEKMHRFMDSNPGLKSRFNKQFLFADYKPDELFEIFKSMCAKQSFLLTEDAVSRAKTICTEMYENRGTDFGNGRDIRNIFESAIARQNNRIVKNFKDPSAIELQTIEAEDLELAVKC